MYQKCECSYVNVHRLNFSFQCNSGNKEEKTEKDENDDASLDDLLLWALYANRPQIAEMGWLRNEHQLSSFQLMINRNKVTSES